MFRQTLRRRVQPSLARVRQYVDHLYPKEGKELVPIADLMPAANEGVAFATDFHRLLIEHLAADRGAESALRAWTCTLAGDGLLRNMGYADPTYSPVPADFVTSLTTASAEVPVLAALARAGGAAGGAAVRASASAVAAPPAPPLVTISKKKNRVQSIEMTLAAQIDEATIGSAQPAILRVAPAVLVRGSRYPFYAPHVPGFTADLASAIHLAVGPSVALVQVPFDLCGLGAVLTLGIEPVAVGYVQRFHLDAAGACSVHIHTHFDAALRKAGAGAAVRGQWWIATGSVARVPAAVGLYKANFGPLGAVSVAVTD